MHPKGLLSEKDYLSIVDVLLDPSVDREDRLDSLESDYLALNRDFYPLLLQAVEKRIAHALELIDALRKENPYLEFGEAVLIVPDYRLLVALREFINARAETAGQQPAETASLPDFEWIREIIAKATEEYPAVSPSQIAWETEELTRIARTYMEGLQSGEITQKNAADDIQIHIDQIEQRLLDHTAHAQPWINVWDDRDGRFTLACTSLVLRQLLIRLLKLGDARG